MLFYFESFLGLAAVAAHRGDAELAAALDAAAWEYNTRPVAALEQPVYDRIGERYLATSAARCRRPASTRRSS